MSDEQSPPRLSRAEIERIAGLPLYENAGLGNRIVEIAQYCLELMDALEQIANYWALSFGEKRLKEIARAVLPASEAS